MKTQETSITIPGPSRVGGWGGGALAPQFLAKQLTLSQPGGQIMPTTVIQAPPDFQTLRRPWYTVRYVKKKNLWKSAILHSIKLQFDVQAAEKILHVI